MPSKEPATPLICYLILKIGTEEPKKYQILETPSPGMTFRYRDEDAPDNAPWQRARCTQIVTGSPPIYFGE